MPLREIIQTGTRLDLGRVQNEVSGDVVPISPAARSSMDKVAKVNVFLADIEADFATFNTIYSRYFPADFPARTAVQARLAFDVLRVEVEAIASC